MPQTCYFLSQHQLITTSTSTEVCFILLDRASLFSMLKLSHQLNYRLIWKSICFFPNQGETKLTFRPNIFQSRNFFGPIFFIWHKTLLWPKLFFPTKHFFEPIFFEGAHIFTRLVFSRILFLLGTTLTQNFYLEVKFFNIDFT